jgi:hypothetical protein
MIQHPMSPWNLQLNAPTLRPDLLAGNSRFAKKLLPEHDSYAHVMKLDVGTLVRRFNVNYEKQAQ